MKNVDHVKKKETFSSLRKKLKSFKFDQTKKVANQEKLSYTWKWEMNLKTSLRLLVSLI